MINRIYTPRIGRAILVAAMVWAGAIGSPVLAQANSTPSTPLQVEGNRLLLHGKPFQILSGELEYARIPRENWKDRLRKVHAMGLNTITVYIFWNLHEPRPGVYDFTGQNDVAEFIREAAAEGLYVVLRPGPYICGEWDLGGYPAWLLKDPHMLLRSSQPNFLAPVRRWMLRLGQELAPLQTSRGGPILAVQVENEYGSFDVPNDAQYLHQMRQIVLDAGFTESLLYTADGADVLAKGTLSGIFAAVDFGTGDAERSIELLRHFRPGAPVYVAEYWDGWFDHWGEKHQLTDAAKQTAEIRAMVEKGYSVSLYMVHGGTSFGWMNGANSDHDGYQPDVSSYDYDAPLDESARPRPKYFALRAMLQEVTHRTAPSVPDSPPLLELPVLRLTESRSLWTALPLAIRSEKPLSMEEVDQAYGYILYRTQFPTSLPANALLDVANLHDYAQVYIDGKLAGTMDRRLGKTQLQLPLLHAGERLDLLVENSGRINFTPKIRGERAGILGEVLLNGHPLNGWEIFPLPLTVPPAGGYEKQLCAGPCLYQGNLILNAPGDTFLDTSHLGKGVLWVNGHLLGRFWKIGPMGSLFLPGAWLHTGANHVALLDLDGGAEKSIQPVGHPIYVELRPE